MSKVALQFHELNCQKTEKTTYSCTTCEQTFTAILTLKRHIQIVHEQIRQVIECDECNEKFSRKDNLTRHKKESHHVANVNHHYSDNCSNPTIHKIRPYQCKDCGKKFKRKNDLDRHQNTLHTKNVTKYSLQIKL